MLGRGVAAAPSIVSAVGIKLPLLAMTVIGPAVRVD